MADNHCEDHNCLSQNLDKLTTNLMWLIRILKWVLGFFVGASFLMVGMFVDLSYRMVKVYTQVELNKAAITKLEKEDIHYGR